MNNRDSRFDEMFDFPLSNVEILYSYFFQPDTKFESCWKCTVLLNPELARAMYDKGFNVRRKDFGSGEVDYILAKRKTHTAKGKAMFPPKVFAENGRTYWDEKVAIGNGTTVNLMVAGKYVTISGKELLPLYLNSVQIVKHVPYSSSPFEDTTGGAGDIKIDQEGIGPQGGTGEDIPF